ncbi:MAG: hypothetical protein ACJ76N_05980 [Thermoanaerobaculia bacterium]
MERKLVLHRETLRDLNDRRLRQVAGANLSAETRCLQCVPDTGTSQIDSCNTCQC